MSSSSANATASLLASASMMPPPASRSGRCACASNAAARWMACALPPPPARPLPLRQQRRGALDGLPVARDASLHRPVRRGVKQLSRDGLVVEEVTRNIEEGRALLARERGAECVLQHLGDAIGLARLHREPCAGV